MTAIIIGALLGVLFHEALRIFKAKKAQKKIYPFDSENKKVDITLYLIILAIFLSVSVFISYYFSAMNPVSAFFLGMGVPSGLSYLKDRNPNISAGERVEDMWNDQVHKKDTIWIKIKKVINSYYV